MSACVRACLGGFLTTLLHPCVCACVRVRAQVGVLSHPSGAGISQGSATQNVLSLACSRSICHRALDALVFASLPHVSFLSIVVVRVGADVPVDERGAGQRRGGGRGRRRSVCCASHLFCLCRLLSVARLVGGWCAVPLFLCWVCLSGPTNCVCLLCVWCVCAVSVVCLLCVCAVSVSVLCLCLCCVLGSHVLDWIGWVHICLSIYISDSAPASPYWVDPSVCPEPTLPLTDQVRNAHSARSLPRNFSLQQAPRVCTNASFVHMSLAGCCRRLCFLL
jgi:hypothetical protein